MTRFKITRDQRLQGTSAPWVVRDSRRPLFLGRYATFDLAITAVEEKLSYEQPERLAS